MNKLGFLTRTTMEIAVAMGLLLLATGFFVLDRQEEMLTELILKNARTVAQSIATSSVNEILTNEYVNLPRHLKEGLEQVDVDYAYILNADGICLAHTDSAQEGRKFTLGSAATWLEEFRSGFQRRDHVVNRSGDVIEVVYPVKIEEIRGFYGLVNLGLNRSEIDRRLAGLRRIFWFIFVVAIALASVLGSLLAARATRPIREINRMAARIAEGDYQVDSHEAEFLEEQELQDSLRAMAGTIESQFDELKDKNRRLDRKVYELETLMSASMKMNTKCYSNEVLDHILDRAVEGLDARWGSILLADTKEQHLVPRVVRGMYDQPHRASCIPLGEGIAGKVYSERVPYVSNRGYEDPLFKRIDENRESNIRSLVCVPLVVNDEAIGVINILNKLDGDFDEDDQRLLVGLASLIARSIENSQLYNLAITDGLTGLFIRRYFEDRLKDTLEQGKRYHQTFSLIYTDIDFFKRVNDTYGHIMGDAVIRNAARILLQEARDNIDLVARIGGEEFAIILPETDKEGAMTFASRVRQRAEETLAKLSGLKDPVTMSFGVATFPDDGREPLGLIESADDALYTSKEGGRNRVTSA